jgi:hypothetical protein
MSGAAGEFVVDRNSRATAQAGAGCRNQKVEAALGTDAVIEIPGSARILAVEVG